MEVTMPATLWTQAEPLEPDECLRLLSSARVGRVGFTGPDGPQVLPVNYTLLDGAIIVRTDLYSTIADGTRGTVVAFEVDELDDRLQSGWSVLAVGEADHVEDRAEMADLFRRAGEPWAPGSRPLVARIVPGRVTGRRFRRG
jgi:nitroimidazol reductase NimA-like FMN-containing flavoprotein (pyridoxamine 5'-phosphate oxidase superfamily)